MGVISDKEYDFNGLKARVLIDALHLQAVKAKEGQKLAAGDIMAIADNTGWSTGPHTHFQFRKVSWDGIKFTNLEINDANNSFDPTPYWSGLFAEDVAMTTLENLKKQLLAALQGLLKG